MQDNTEKILVSKKEYLKLKKVVEELRERTHYFTHEYSPFDSSRPGCEYCYYQDGIIVQECKKCFWDKALRSTEISAFICDLQMINDSNYTKEEIEELILKWIKYEEQRF